MFQILCHFCMPLLFSSSFLKRKQEVICDIFVATKKHGLCIKRFGNYTSLSIRTFEIIVASIAKLNFWGQAMLMKYWRTNDTSHPPSCFIIRSILMTSQPGCTVWNLLLKGNDNKKFNSSNLKQIQEQCTEVYCKIFISVLLREIFLPKSSELYKYWNDDPR